MPIADYRCERGHVREDVFSVQAPPQMIPCEDCERVGDHGVVMHREVTAPGLLGVPASFRFNQPAVQAEVNRELRRLEARGVTGRSLIRDMDRRRRES